MLFWWGIFISATQSFGEAPGAGFFTLLGPLFITYLLFGLSGMPILEKKANEKFGHSAGYLQYREETSLLIPLPRGLYRATPLAIKRMLLCALLCTYV